MARLYLTGGLRIEGPDGNFGGADLPGGQGRVAFAALAIERRPVSHDRLADIVWDANPPNQWKSALAAVISKTRALLAHVGFDAAETLTSSGGTYAFVPTADTWIDLEQAWRRLDRAEGSLRHGDPADASREATVASAIFRRPLLPGESGRWLDAMRRQQLDALYRTYVTLAAAWNTLGDHQMASTTAEAAIEIDPYRERGHRLLIEIERNRGDSGAAIRALRRCEQVFSDEIGVPLSPETLHLAGLLRRGGD